ncbi:transglycosylase SLT domain-containing protein [Patulibacter defluvii]|uniref:transglycosylase SLT domain-containing protein n=1 Tax=Patulibacter defluvii TaxID=3095358 RepID=UPI002A763A3E|nr:transglycosylase SLT domain-containing protein [Patulibacter sp. DM4]
MSHVPAAGAPPVGRPRARSLRALLALALAALASGVAAGSASAAAAIPCSPSGGKFNCQFYPAGNGITAGAPVLNPAGERIGYLNEGTNWVICQQAGRSERSGAYYNKWWAFTQANNQKWGWVNAVWAKGGDNDGVFGGVPNCNGSKGNAPGGGSPPGPGTPPPPPQPSTCGSAPGAGDSVTRWAPVVRCVLGMLGQPQSDAMVNNVFIIIRHESGGNPNAINNWDSNAQKGQPSQGLMQVIPSTFQWRRSTNLPNAIKDPAANIFAGLNYGIRRYGSVVNIPGVASVLAGGRYKPYAAAQLKGAATATRCRTTRSGRLRLAVNGSGQKCAQARKAAARLDRQGAIRQAKAAASDLVVRAGKDSWLCTVDPTRHGKALRAVSCQSGKRTLWWSATKAKARRR